MPRNTGFFNGMFNEVKPVVQNVPMKSVTMDRSGAFSGVAARLVLQIGRPPRAGFVAHTRALDLEDVRSKIAKELGARWAGQNAAEI
jgi:hypothetical protein